MRKTQRRVNALEKVVIPRYEATVDTIVDSLEEEDCEAIVYAKQVKAMHEEVEKDLRRKFSARQFDYLIHSTT